MVIGDRHLDQGHCGPLQTKATNLPSSACSRAAHTGLRILGRGARAGLLVARLAWEDQGFKWVFR